MSSLPQEQLTECLKDILLCSDLNNEEIVEFADSLKFQCEEEPEDFVAEDEEADEECGCDCEECDECDMSKEVRCQAELGYCRDDDETVDDDEEIPEDTILTLNLVTGEEDDKPIKVHLKEDVVVLIIDRSNKEKISFEDAFTLLLQDGLDALEKQSDEVTLDLDDVEDEKF